ncbi:MAG: hypothetical protein ACYC61_32715 [Isosphaeraceae bacterium]
MFRPGIKLASSMLVAVGTGTLGYMASAQQGAAGPPAGAARGPALKDTARKCLEARVETARQIVEADMNRFINGMGTTAEIPAWSHRLMADRIQLARNRADRIKAIREHRRLMSDLEEMMTAFAKTGQVRMADALKAKYYRLEADQLLADEGIDPEKEPIDPGPRKGKAEKAAPPPAAPIPSRR